MQLSLEVTPVELEDVVLLLQVVPLARRRQRQLVGRAHLLHEDGQPLLQLELALGARSCLRLGARRRAPRGVALLLGLTRLALGLEQKLLRRVQLLRRHAQQQPLGRPTRLRVCCSDHLLELRLRLGRSALRRDGLIARALQLLTKLLDPLEQLALLRLGHGAHGACLLEFCLSCPELRRLLLGQLLELGDMELQHSHALLLNRVRTAEDLAESLEGLQHASAHGPSNNHGLLSGYLVPVSC